LLATDKTDTETAELLLEDALARFQHRYDRLAFVVNDKGAWTGILTFDDVLEEISRQGWGRIRPGWCGPFQFPCRFAGPRPSLLSTSSAVDERSNPEKHRRHPTGRASRRPAGDH